MSASFDVIIGHVYAVLWHIRVMPVPFYQQNILDVFVDVSLHVVSQGESRSFYIAVELVGCHFL